MAWYPWLQNSTTYTSARNKDKNDNKFSGIHDKYSLILSKGQKTLEHFYFFNFP